MSGLLTGLPSVIAAAAGAVAGVYLDPIPNDWIPGAIPRSFIQGIEASAGVFIVGFALDMLPQLGSLTTLQKEQYMLSTFISTTLSGFIGNSFNTGGLSSDQMMLLAAGGGVIVSAFLPDKFHIIKNA